MNDLITRTPPAANEPVLSYSPGSPERVALEAELARLAGERFDIPLVIGGRELRTGRTLPLARPDDLGSDLGVWHQAGAAEATLAVETALAVRSEWIALPWEERAAVFLRAAALVSGKYRATLVAATMLGQGKTVHQAEIDAACEVADFLRINPGLMARVYAEQPDSGPLEWNRLSYRPLEGFVYAVSPFNFTAIAANLATAPAMMGNVVVWKPASSSILSNWYLMKILVEAGLPPGVVNFVPGRAAEVTGAVVARPEFAGLHFTGSTAVFNSLWKNVAANLESYRAYPRLVGETGGKGFVFVDPSADPEVALVAALRGAFEYQGQKCSAASRLYLPASLAPAFLGRLSSEIGELAMGRVDDFSNFLSAVIDEAAFDRLSGHLERARKDPGLRVLAGGKGARAQGWYVEPSLLLSEEPRSTTMVEELFGPVLSTFVYDEKDMEGALRLVDTTSPYGLTGAVIATDRRAIVRDLDALRFSAGNLYVNDKPTGAVVGRQAFGGMRGSGTNDKAGSLLNLLRWTNAGAVKENLAPPLDWHYPHQRRP